MQFDDSIYPAAKPVKDKTILDAARQPFEDFKGNKVTSVARFTWLTVLRPFLMSCFWIFLCYFVYKHFTLKQSEIVSLLRLYLIVFVIMGAIIFFATPIRRYEIKSELTQFEDFESTLPGVADYTGLDTSTLSESHHSQRIVVKHDEHGRIEKLT